MKDSDIEKIIANMGDAGCSSADIDRVCRLHEAGFDGEIVKCLLGSNNVTLTIKAE